MAFPLVYIYIYIAIVVTTSSIGAPDDATMPEIAKFRSFWHMSYPNQLFRRFNAIVSQLKISLF